MENVETNSALIKFFKKIISIECLYSCVFNNFSISLKIIKKLNFLLKIQVTISQFTLPYLDLDFFTTWKKRI